ncbi:MAG: ATP-dependent RNA helicase HrpA, partial [Propionibacteriaceae bacterium]
MPTPVLTFDPGLPISSRVEEITAALTEHQVLVVAGETGSGKTTQLPKMCLAAGRKKIAHTQPRRIAARTVAERIATEMQVELGELVGYQVRFTRKASAQTQLKVMTDGVLLNEISRDRDLHRYDTIIIDEAHERSLNIDFLLGYLKQLTGRRPDLKIIITSATIDTTRFSEHFDHAPVVGVSGRGYPVELRYRPLLPDDAEAEARDQTEAICEAVIELVAEPAGDILVFLAGEREIRDTADALTELLAAGRALPRLMAAGLEILPWYARLSTAEQHRVFAAHTGRRIVLATNVAETSLTVPGIRYVVDPGTARISRYSARTKVQRLPIEPISQASANQRAGRCGRVAAGVCIRLYTESDFESRPEFTDPEILRTNLASVILQMADAGLGAIADFPFVEPPDSARITDGLRLLTELGAIETARTYRATRTADRATRGPKLTPIGRQLARIPLDPRMARMLVEADRLGCLREVMVIVAGLTIPDPRERPAEQQDRADALHRRFWAPRAGETSEPPAPDGSDFLAWLRLWSYLRTQRKELSGNAFRRMCRDEFLHYLRIREWQDLHTQLRDIANELGLHRNTNDASAEMIHTAILAGSLSQVGLADLREEDKQGRTQRGGGRRRRAMREYLGARGTRFAINPGSSVARTQPELVMAAEIVETSRLWARTVAGI